jgi:hypothetical protein
MKAIRTLGGVVVETDYEAGKGIHERADKWGGQAGKRVDDFRNQSLKSQGPPFCPPR